MANKNTNAQVVATPFNAKNVKLTVTGSTLTIEIDLTKDYGLSKQGKSNIVASSGGFIGLADGVGVSLNVVKRAA